MRNVYMIAIALILLGMTPLLAENPSLAAIPRQVPAVGGETQGALATAITAALPDPNFTGFGGNGVPCFNCVPTSAVTNVGLSVPLTWVTRGSSITFVLAVDVYSFSGVGNFIYSIREGERSQNGKEVARGNVAAGVYPANWLAYFPGTAPGNPGRYTLLGEFDAGGAVSVVTTPLIVQ